MTRAGFLATCALALAVAAYPGAAGAAGKDHGAMHGGGKTEGHGMMNMGDKVFEGNVGPWHGQARLTDMKAQMEKAKSSGAKMEGMMAQTHHLAVSLTDPKAKTAVAEGKGTVTVIGPDKSETTSDFMVMGGHFGADVALPKPGKYTFKVAIESGGKKGSASFSRVIK